MVLEKGFSQTIPGGLRWGPFGHRHFRGRVAPGRGGDLLPRPKCPASPESAQAASSFCARAPGRPSATATDLSHRTNWGRAGFRQANLLQDLADLPLADIVFLLRNVLIYFAPEDRKACLTNVFSRMRSGAHLILGHSDSHHQLPRRADPLRPRDFPGLRR